MFSRTKSRGFHTRKSTFGQISRNEGFQVKALNFPHSWGFRYRIRRLKAAIMFFTTTNSYDILLPGSTSEKLKS